ncbi:uncharacterized protein LOC114843542 isoform X2 [Betta splendens]|nr:uncharacterized protein LOC114843542 isoform X2 [Betta splendens]
MMLLTSWISHLTREDTLRLISAHMFTLSTTMEDCSLSQPESGRGLCTQESGQDGFSSDMRHRFSDNYTERQPFTIKGNTGPHPVSVAHLHVLPMMPEAHSANKNLTNLMRSTAQEIDLAQAEAAAMPGGTPPKTSAVAAKQPDVEMEAGCMKRPDKEPDRLAEPKGPVLVAGKRRSRGTRGTKGHRKRKWKVCLFILMAVVPVVQSCARAPAFVCLDQKRCTNIISIFGLNNTNLYQRAPEGRFPPCSGSTVPPDGGCAVCLNSNVTILCSEAAGHYLEVEANGETIDNALIAPTEPVQLCGRGHTLAAGLGLVLVLAAVLLIA